VSCIYHRAYAVCGRGCGCGCGTCGCVCRCVYGFGWLGWGVGVGQPVRGWVAVGVDVEMSRYQILFLRKNVFFP